MPISLLSFPESWKGSVRCSYLGFRGLLKCTAKRDYYNTCDVTTAVSEMCACHGFCHDHCSNALTNPKRGADSWTYLLAPYLNLSVCTTWARQVMDDVTQKLNALDQNNGIGVLHGLLLHGDDDVLCSNFLELGVNPEKPFLALPPTLRPKTPAEGVAVDEKLNGGTAVHFAAFLDRPKCLSVLLEAGADMKAKTAEGLTAYDLSTDHPEVKKILEVAVTSGSKSFAQLAKEGTHYAMRHKLRSGKLTSSDLASRFEGKTALDWVWDSMCAWRFTLKLDVGSMAPFKIMSEMKYRFLWCPAESSSADAAGASAGNGVDGTAGTSKDLIIFETLAAISSEMQEFLP